MLALTIIIMLGMAVFVPFDGKRVRLRNTPFPEDTSEGGGAGGGGGGENKMNIELPLFSDRRIRIVSSGAVFSGSYNSCHGIQDHQDNNEISKMQRNVSWYYYT